MVGGRQTFSFPYLGTDFAPSSTPALLLLRAQERTLQRQKKLSEKQPKSWLEEEDWWRRCRVLQIEFSQVRLVHKVSVIPTPLVAPAHN